ncbi:protein kinase [Blastopirellula sp. JC732]|uniref:non-specific serine/threonine protein kinase n=1 Tax=Blastopirellula sediminis TaxID=2894196 RepID=A0A9X1MQF9_9BACT|nr:protein kinase [Blastopirellula sediminis]MCC9606207.1 protein kinase [Blastopirellula sediminis]MCC9630495.1 protein kinase [Blastopirellula sediminis]
MNEREIFAAALEQPTEAERQAFLNEVCDDEMRPRIERLLKEQAQLGSFLEHPPLDSDSGVLNGISPTMVLGSGSTCDDEGDAISSEGINMTKNQQDPEDKILLSYLEPATRDDALGRLGHYEVLEVVGKGAFGTVLRAFDTKLERIVAIKVLALEMASMSPARKRFLREARTSAQIRHDNVVSIYSVEEEPIPYLVMEYVPGRTLQQQLKDHGPLDLPSVLRLGKQIADGLAAAHAQDLIHRDIKPGNILLEGDMEERIKITDFGLARTVDDSSMTQSGMIAGTPMYMAPEQAYGRKLDQRADLFSFGSVLYQMISGRPPFRSTSTMAVLKRVTEDAPRPIQEIIPEAPDWLCDLIGHLHAKDPAKRYGSAKDVANLLGQCLVDIQAGRTPTIPSPAELGGERGTAVTPRVETTPLLRRPHVKIAAAVLLLVAVTGIAGRGFWLPSASEPTPNPPPYLSAIVPDDSIPKRAAEEQVETVRRELKRLNPKFDETTLEATIEDGVVVELKFLSDYVSDITPVGALKGLKSLSCNGSYDGSGGWNSSGLSQVADLSPLRGLPLNSLMCSATQVSDLSPLKGMPLEHVGVGLTPVEDLSPLDPAPLKTLFLMRTNITDESLQHFKGCTNITKLVLFTNHEITDVGIGAFSECKGLVELYLDGTKVTNRGLALFDSLPDLDKLGLSYTSITNDGVKVFANSKKLTSLSLGHTKVTELGLAVFRGRTWTKLDLHGTQITDEGLKLYFPDCGSLRSLNLGGTQITDAGLAHFAGCEELEELNLDGNPQIGDAGLAHFAGCSNLKKVQLPGTGVTDAGMVHLRNCRQLEWISLNGMRVGDAGLANLRDCTELAYVNLSTNSAITDAGIAHLATCRNLRELHLSWTKIGDAGVANLSGCPNLEILHLRSSRMTNAGLKKLVEDCPKLRDLRAYGPEVTDFSPLKNLPDLETIAMDFQPDRDTELLRSISSLQRINVSDDWRAVQTIEDFWKEVDQLGRFKSGEWIEVLPLVDPKLDKQDEANFTGANDWYVENGTLVVGDKDDKPHNLLFPIDSNWSAYEVEMKLTEVSQGSGFNVSLPCHPRRCPIGFTWPNQPGVIIGAVHQKKETTTLSEADIVETGQPKTIRIVVRQGDEDHVSLWLGSGDDAEQVGEWTGDLPAIAIDDERNYDQSRRLGVITLGGSRIVFHRIRVRMLDGGAATTTRPVANPR